MEQKNNTKIPKNDEISLAEIIQITKDWWKYLIRKWVIICIFGFGGAALGLGASFLIKPKYTAHLSFSLIDNSSGGGLADLASSFGFNFFGTGSNGAFSGDNLLEIIKSRYAIEETLLIPVNYKGKTKTLAEVYIDFNKKRKAWLKEKKNIELKQLAFPINQNRETFNRSQDSVLYVIFDEIITSNALTVLRKNKKVSIVNIDLRSKDEVFSKLFVETLMDVTYRFYSHTRTSQSRANINMIQHTADSIKNLYEKALYKGAGYSQININQALQYAAVPRMKQQTDAQLYGTVYAEVLKNLETLKLDLARETPLVQIIDVPRYPLLKKKFGKLKGIVFGGFFGGLFIVGYLLIRKYFRESI